MSAEGERAEPQKGDMEHLGSSGVSYVRKNWAVALKILELVFAIVCVGLVVDPLNYARIPNLNIHHVAMIYTAYTGYIIINSVVILGHLFGERLGSKTAVLFCLVGSIVFAAAGGVIIYDWNKYMYNHIFHPSKQYMDMFCSSGVFAIFNACLYLLDAILTYREDF